MYLSVPKELDSNFSVYQCRHNASVQFELAWILKHIGKVVKHGVTSYFDEPIGVLEVVANVLQN